MVIIENNKVKELETIIKKSDRQLVDILRKILNIQVDKIIIEKRLKLKNISEYEFEVIKTKAKLENEYGVKAGDSIFFIADEFHKAQKIAGLVRIELGKRLNLLEKDTYRFCFIVDFPMYELSDEGTIDFCHNPFSMPQGGLDALESKDPLDILAYQFDLVCNGYETMSGAVRNHDPEIMVKAFEIAGYTEEDVKIDLGHYIMHFNMEHLHMLELHLV